MCSPSQIDDITRATIRLAKTEADRAAVYQLRYELYVEGQNICLDQADHERRWLCDEYDAGSDILLAEIDGRVVGTSRMTFDSDVDFAPQCREEYGFAQFEDITGLGDLSVITRLMVRPELRGSSLGRQLFWKSYELAALRGAELILGACELHLINYYWKLGFRPFGALWNHPCNGFLVRIAVVTGDLQHMRDVESPMTSALARRTRPTDNVPNILTRVAECPGVTSAARMDAEVYWQTLQDRLDEPCLPEIFQQLEEDERRTLLHKSHLLQFNPGDALMHMEQTSRTAYILLSGSLVVHPKGSAPVQVTRPGTLVGEVAYLGADRRLDDVVAGEGGAQVLALDGRTLQRLMKETNPLAAKLLAYVAREMCRKLQQRADAAEERQAVPVDVPASRRRRPRQVLHRERLLASQRGRRRRREVSRWRASRSA